MDEIGTVIIEREMTPEEIEERAIWEAGQHERDVAAVEANRKFAYQNESDPLFFGHQRGDNTEQEWLDKVQEIKDRYPYPEQP